MVSRVSSFITLSRHQIYYLQLRVPKHIRQNTHINQKLIRKSLGTRHRGTAIRLARKMAVQMGDVYDELFVINNRISSARMWRTHFKEENGQQYADDWVAERLTHYLDLCGTNPFYIREFFHILAPEEVDLIANYDSALLAKADRVLTNNPDSVILSTGSKSPIESILQGNDRSMQTPTNTPFPNTSPIASVAPSQGQMLTPEQLADTIAEMLEAKRTAGKRTPLLSELREEFLQSKIDDNASQSYRAELTDRTSWFVDAIKYFNGGIMPKTDEITSVLLSNYAILIKKLPAHINKRGSIKHLNRDDQIRHIINRTGEQLRDEGFELLKNRTKNFYFDYALALLNYGEQTACSFNENLEKEKYFRKLDESGDSDDRLAFTTQELKMMFESEQYKHAKLSKASYYWTPLIALYTGATQAEILQLYVSDVRIDRESNIWYFSFEAEDEAKSAGDKQMKTPKSRRRKVAIHKALKDLGFIDFVKGRKKKGFKQLFPEEKRNSNGKFKNFSSWFNERFKTKFNIKRGDGKRKDFHNLRHCLATKLVGHNYDIGIANAIMGHASKNRNETEMTYSDGLFLPEQDKIIQKIDYGINHKYPKRFIDKLAK